MKKIFAIALALVMVLGIATSALAISWGAPTVSSSSSPFAAEVIKLGANSGVTGTEYFTILTDAAAYDYSNIFYAIKLSIPSASQANAAYSGAKYSVGDQIKVTINYTNVKDKSSDTKYVTIGSSAKTLWYNGSVFEESWVPSLNNSCGCGDSHVLKATATGNKEVKIKVCFAAKGKLSDIKIAGCYSVEKKEYCGIKPCVNCKPVDLNGFVFSGDCAKFKVFFSTTAAGKVNGVYAIDACGDGYKTKAYGSMKEIGKTLYGWAITGVNCPTCPVNCTGKPFEVSLQPLNKGTLISTDMEAWFNTNTKGDMDTRAKVLARVASCGVVKSDVYSAMSVASGTKETVDILADWDKLYLQRDDGTFCEVANATPSDDILKDIVLGTSNLYRNAKSGAKTANGYVATTDMLADVSGKGYKESTKGTETTVMDLNGTDTLLVEDSDRFLPEKIDATTGKATSEKDWSKYDFAAPTTGAAALVYGETYYFCFDAEVDQLFQQLTADKVSCDTNDAAYLNSINHLYSVLGFTYADVAAGNVYMTEDILLANFGFAIAPCSEAVWGAYTAAITVAAVAEVPATGSVAFAGFAMLALAIGAAVASKKNA